MGEIRQAHLEDHRLLVESVQDWWGDSRTAAEARELSLLLPKLFLEHFARTSLIMDGPTGVDGFLVGFDSPDRPDESYIHFVGVRPERRGEGVARQLYERFFERAAATGRTRVRAITSPANKGSIAFHHAMGFELEESPHVTDGIPVHPDYDGPGQDRVCFRLRLR